MLPLEFQEYFYNFNWWFHSIFHWILFDIPGSCWIFCAMSEFMNIRMEYFCKTFIEIAWNFNLKMTEAEKIIGWPDVLLKDWFLVTVLQNAKFPSLSSKMPNFLLCPQKFQIPFPCVIKIEHILMLLIFNVFGSEAFFG